MAELGVAYVSVIPDTSKLAAGIKGSAIPAADTAGRESGKRFGGRFSSAIGGALKTAGKAGLVGAGIAAGATILSGVKSAINQESSEATLAGLYGSAKTASRLMKDLKKVASTSTIDYTTYAKTAEALAYMGISGKDAPEMLENIGDAIAGAGGGGEEMDRAAQGLLKMVNAGKVELDSLNQLSDAGVPIYSALAAQAGKSIANVRQMVSEGKIGIDDVQSAIANAEGKSFKRQISSAKEVEKTLSGRFKILKDNVVTSLGTMFQPGIRAASDFVAKVNDALFGGGGGLRERLASMFSGVDLSQLTKTGAALKDFFAGLMPAISSVASQFKRALGPAVKTIGRAFTEDFLPGVRAILPVLQPIISFIIRFVGGALVGAFKGAVQIIRGVFQTIGGLFRFIRAVVTGQWGKAWDSLKQIASGVMNTIVGAIKVWWNLGIIAVFRRGILLILKPFGKMFARLFGLAKGGVKKVTGALRPIVGFITKVLGKTFRWLWRKVVQPAFRGIGRLAGWLWNKAIKPAFAALRAYFTKILFPVIRFLWKKVVTPVFRGIGKIAGWLWNKAVKPIFSAWRAFFTKILFPVIRFLWNKVVGPAFRGIGKIAGWLWNKAVKPIFSAWRAYFTKFLFPIISRLWNGVAKPVFNKLGDAVGFLWNKVAKPAFSRLRKGFSKVGEVISWVWTNVLKKPLDLFKKVLDTIKDSIGWVLGKVKDLKDLPGSVFGGIKGGASKLKFWATGGPVSGPGSGTSDSIPAMLSNGEYIINAAAVRRYGPGLFDALNDRRPARVATFAAGGLVGSINTGTSSPGRLLKAIRSLVRMLREKVVPALLRTRRRTTTPTTPERPPKAQTAPVRKGRGRADFLQGFDIGGRGRSRRRKDFLGQVIPNQPFIAKTLKRISRDTVGMELAIGKSTKKLGKYWTDVERGPIRRFRKRWKTAIAKDSVRDVRSLDQGVKKQTGNTGKRLRSFTSGPVKTFAKNWSTTFRKKTPDDVATFRQRTSDHMRNTASNFSSTWSDRIRPLLGTFGSYARKTVAPAFGRGVDAIGKQWDRVKSKLRGPVKYVVTSVINGALIGAFNKIAKFVDSKTIGKAKLPKNFRTGGVLPGYTPGRDVHTFVSPTGGRLHLSGGESIMRPEWTRDVGGPRAVARMNDDARRKRGRSQHRYPPPRPRRRQDQRFWKGGTYPIPGHPVTNFHGTSYYDSFWAADMAAPTGTTIRAWKKGIVAQAAMNGEDGSYGNVTVINHVDGNWTRSAHQSAIGVRGGQRVTQGQKIGMSGATGNVTGPHLHFEIGGGNKAIVPGGGGGGFALPKWVQTIVNSPKKWAQKLLNGGDELKGYGYGRLLQDALNTLVKPSADWAENELGAAAYSGPMTGAVTRFTPIIRKVLKALGEPAGPTLMSAILARMQQESGGNVGIVNKWDSNWTAGHPSVGLMQVIGPTYQAHKPRPDKGPYKYGTSIDPYSNIYAGLHYARGRYDSIYKAMVKSGGYDDGGVARGIGVMSKGVIEPERVLKPRETRSFEHMVRANFRPATSGTGRLERVEMVITNWDRGTGYIQGIAAAEDGQNLRHARAMGALH